MDLLWLHLKILKLYHKSVACQLQESIFGASQNCNFSADKGFMFLRFYKFSFNSAAVCGQFFLLCRILHLIPLFTVLARYRYFYFWYLPIQSTVTAFIAFVIFLHIGYRNPKDIYNVSWLT